jgi:hypothetical protein
MERKRISSKRLSSELVICSLVVLFHLSTRCFAVSTALEDWEINNIRRTKEWLANGVTKVCGLCDCFCFFGGLRFSCQKGKVHDEYGSRILELVPPPFLTIGMDVVERRTRNREKLKKVAQQLLHEQV